MSSSSGNAEGGETAGGAAAATAAAAAAAAEGGETVVPAAALEAAASAAGGSEADGDRDLVQVVELFPVGHRRRRDLVGLDAAQLRARYMRLDPLTARDLAGRGGEKGETGGDDDDDDDDDASSPSSSAPVSIVATLPKEGHMVVDRAAYARQFKLAVKEEVDRRSVELFREERERIAAYVAKEVTEAQGTIHEHITKFAMALAVAAARDQSDPNAKHLASGIESALKRERDMLAAAFSAAGIDADTKQAMDMAVANTAEQPDAGHVGADAAAAAVAAATAASPAASTPSQGEGKAEE